MPDKNRQASSPDRACFISRMQARPAPSYCLVHRSVARSSPTFAYSHILSHPQLDHLVRNVTSIILLQGAPCFCLPRRHKSERLRGPYTFSNVLAILVRTIVLSFGYLILTFAILATSATMRTCFHQSYAMTSDSQHEAFEAASRHNLAFPHLEQSPANETSPISVHDVNEAVLPYRDQHINLFSTGNEVSYASGLRECGELHTCRTRSKSLT